MTTDRKYATVSIPIGIARAVDELLEELGYWPSRGAFVREATLEKIRDEQMNLVALRKLREARKAVEKQEE